MFGNIRLVVWIFSCLEYLDHVDTINEVLPDFPRDKHLPAHCSSVSGCMYVSSKNFQASVYMYVWDILCELWVGDQGLVCVYWPFILNHCIAPVRLSHSFRSMNSFLQMLVNSSRNHANGFRGVCTLGRWTHLQHCMVLESGALEGWGWWQITLYSRTFTGVWLAWEAAVSKLWGFMDKR